MELIIQAVDKDGNRQLSYAEFFSAQKNNTIPPAAKDALDKLTKFLTKPLEERNKISINNKENFDRLIREKEEVLQYNFHYLCLISFYAGHPKGS